MAGFGGFAGLAAVPKGYDQGAQGYWATQGLEQDHAAMEALGRGLQLLAPQGAMPGAMQAPGGPQQGIGPPPQAGPGMGPPPPQAPTGGPMPPMGGGPPPGMVNPGRVQGQPQNLTGPVIPPGGFGPQAAPMPGGQPMQSPANPAGQVGNPAGQVAGLGGFTQVAKDQSRAQQFQQPMTWQAVAQAVVKANPGAPAAVIAAAVTKAMPLMQADSQQQWRMIQAQLAEQRIQQQGDLGGRRIAATERGQDIGLEKTREQQAGAGARTEATVAGRAANVAAQQEGAGARQDKAIGSREKEGAANRTSREGIAGANRDQRTEQFNTREARLNEGLAIRRQSLEERIRQFDTRSQAQAKQFAEKAEAARAKVEQARDDKARLAAVNEWDKTQRAYDSYMRNKINAATNLSGAEKTKVLADLDREFKQFLTEKEQLSAGQGGSGQPQMRQRAKNPQTGAEVEWDGKAWVPVGP